MGCAITTISSNLTEMSKGVKLLAALMDDEVGSGEDLLRAARTLAGAVSDLLKAVQPTSGEVSFGVSSHSRFFFLTFYFVLGYKQLTMLW